METTQEVEAVAVAETVVCWSCGETVSAVHLDSVPDSGRWECEECGEGPLTFERCDVCDALVPEHELQSVNTVRATQGDPGDWLAVCESCQSI